MTYYTGIDHPDQEPSRNRFREKDRQSKFTEKVAKDVKDGDLYFMRRSTAAMRFYVPVEPEDGIEGEGELIVVTHRFNKRWEDMPGKWEPYDAGGNLVIKVRETEGWQLTHSAMSTIESALYHTRLGRVVGRDALREMAQALAKALGVDIDRDEYEASPAAFRTNPVEEQRARDALKALLTYSPENGYDEALGPIFAEADGVGFARDGVAYASLINGESDGFDEAREREPLPFLSQPVFYGVLGWKDNGRSFQARIDELMQAVGLEEDDLR